MSTSNASVTCDTDQTMASSIVAIGASAGGLRPLLAFFSAVRSDTGAAFVIAQHLSPDFKSLMTEFLAKVTDMPIVPVLDRERIAANTIYWLPPKRNLVVTETEVISALREPASRHNQRPIDTLFESVAAHWSSRGLAVVLSGGGTDGSQGVTSIHRNGGLVLAQHPDSAVFSSMPLSSVRSGCVHQSLFPEQLAVRVTQRCTQSKLAVQSVGTPELLSTL
jgi:two-component system CheB/CheR fusion protein